MGGFSAAKVHGSFTRLGLLRSALLVAGSLAATATLYAGVSGETCDDPLTINIGSVSGSTAFADDDGDVGSPDCDMGDFSPDVYYAFTPEQSGNYTVSTCGGITNFDTILSVHDGCPPEDYYIACNDDDCGSQSTVTFYAEEFETYIIRVAGYDGDSGLYTLTLSGSAPPCGCETAIPIFGNTINSAPTAIECFNSCNDTSIGTTWAWTPDLDGFAIVNISNYSFPAALSIHSACPLTEANRIDCTDSDQLQVCVEAGSTYYVHVGARDGVGGMFTLLTIVLDTNIYEGPFINPANNHGYYLLNSTNWTGAESAALSQLGTHLATINDANENEWVRSNLLNLGGFQFNAWTGLNDVTTEGTYVWVDGQPVTYTNWEVGQPGGGTSENYGFVASNGRWYSDSNCPNLYLGLVEVEQIPLPGVLAGPIRNPAICHDYYLLEPGTWLEARMAAQQLGGSLVTIDDAAENEWVRTTFANYNNEQRTIWIGLSDSALEGTYVWESGAPLSYTNWTPGEPNNLGNEDYVAMNEPSTGTWNDAHSGDRLRSVVELPASYCIPGDMNCDGVVNNFDIDPFVQALTDPDGYAAQYPNCNINNADVNHDNAVNNFDIDSFVNCLVHAGCP